MGDNEDANARDEMTRLIEEEADRRDQAPPPRIRRSRVVSPAVTMGLAAVAIAALALAITASSISWRENRGPAYVPARPVSLDALAEYMPVASFAADGNALTIRVTDDWIRESADERHRQFTALCFHAANLFYHSVEVRDLQGLSLARWDGGMVELTR